MTAFQKACELLNSMQPGEERVYSGGHAFNNAIYEVRALGVDLHTRKSDDGRRLISKPLDPKSVSMTDIALKSLEDGLITEHECLLLTRPPQF